MFWPVHPTWKFSFQIRNFRWNRQIKLLRWGSFFSCYPEQKRVFTTFLWQFQKKYMYSSHQKKAKAFPKFVRNHTSYWWRHKPFLAGFSLFGIQVDNDFKTQFSEKFWVQLEKFWRELGVHFVIAWIWQDLGMTSFPCPFLHTHVSSRTCFKTSRWLTAEKDWVRLMVVDGFSPCCNFKERKKVSKLKEKSENFWNWLHHALCLCFELCTLSSWIGFSLTLISGLDYCSKFTGTIAITGFFLFILFFFLHLKCRQKIGFLELVTDWPLSWITGNTKVLSQGKFSFAQRFWQKTKGQISSKKTRCANFLEIVSHTSGEFPSAGKTR